MAVADTTYDWTDIVTYGEADELPLRRQVCGRGFTYRDVAGKVVRCPRIRQRIKALAIPRAGAGVHTAITVFSVVVYCDLPVFRFAGVLSLPRIHFDHDLSRCRVRADIAGWV